MKLPRWRSAALTLITVLITAVNGAGTEADAQHTPRSPIVIAVQKSRPSVVVIRLSKSPFQKRDAVGTGVIVHKDGYVVTNRHVIGSSKTATVQLYNGRRFTAKVVHSEVKTDLALLRLQAEQEFAAIPLAPARELWVGEEVIAVGHPLDYAYTVTRGIICALDRKVRMPSGAALTGLIQTDASINPGNSGGPLLNVHGQLIGINVALRDDAHGIAFAINAGAVREFVACCLGPNWSTQAATQITTQAGSGSVEKPPLVPIVEKFGNAQDLPFDRTADALNKNVAPALNTPSEEAANAATRPDPTDQSQSVGDSSVENRTATAADPNAVKPVLSAAAYRPMTLAMIVLMLVILGQQFVIYRQGGGQSVRNR